MHGRSATTKRLLYYFVNPSPSSRKAVWVKTICGGGRGSPLIRVNVQVEVTSGALGLFFTIFSLKRVISTSNFLFLFGNTVVEG